MVHLAFDIEEETLEIKQAYRYRPDGSFSNSTLRIRLVMILSRSALGNVIRLSVFHATFQGCRITPRGQLDMLGMQSSKISYRVCISVYLGAKAKGHGSVGHLREVSPGVY